jgi:PAS domain S-box-containing protein
VKIYPRILLNTLPLILAGLLFAGGLTYYLSQKAMSNLAEKWLATKLADALRVASEDLAVLRKYGLEKIEANVNKAQHHAGEAIKAIAVGDNGFIWVVNTKGIIVIHPDNNRVGARIAEEKWFPEMIGRRSGNSDNYGRSQKLLTVFAYFAPWDWYVMASAPQSELYGEADKMRSYVLIVGIAASVLMALVMMILARRLTAPLNTLANEAQRIGRGDHRVVPILERGDEIGTLSLAFNNMTRQLSRRIAQEQMVSDISRQFIHLSSSNIDAAISKALKKIGAYCGADRSYVGQFCFDDRQVGKTHEWCRQGVLPQIDDMVGLSLDALPWLMRRLEDEGHILVPDIEALPGEAIAEKLLWHKRGVKSVARVPMIYGGELRGFVGLDALGQYRDWSHEEIVVLQRVAEIFCYTLERQWYQESLAAEKERLAVTLQSIADGVITTDVEGRVTLVNRVAELLTGWWRNDAVGRPIDEVFTILDEKTHTILSNPVAKILEAGGGPMATNPAILVARDESQRLIAFSAAPIFDKENKIIGGVLVFRDITEKRRMQDELIKVEKLESLGVLAGGIAHDFNNILTAIIGNVALARSYAEPGGKVSAKMGEIEKAAFRARDLTQRLLTFSKGGEPVKKTISLSQIFYDLAMFALGGSNVGLEYNPPQDLWPVEADESQISQVINNLVINAVQAMPAGGVIQGTLKNIILPAASSVPLPEGRYIVFSFRDYGSGIAKENLNRIFDPFFTTKKAGSGLGLSTAYSIIEKHGGYITAESQLGQGALFTVYLPASDKEFSDLPNFKTEMARGNGKVLIMDDEEIILDVVAAILSNAGYSVAFARDGRQMLDIYQEAQRDGDAFDVVILDLTIPGGMGGKEAIGRLLQLDPQAKALVSSGYSNDPVMADFSSFGFCGAVVKPYKIEDLCKAVNDILRRAN